MIDSPLSPSALRDLLFRPSRFFGRPDLPKQPEVVLVAWLAGIASAINRVDHLLTRSEAGHQENALLPLIAGNWIALWLFVVCGGALSGAVLWLVAGWWYRKRLEWSGAIAPDRQLARCVYVYQNVVSAAADILLVIGYTIAFESYNAAYHASVWWSDLPLVFAIWSCFTSYVAATRAPPSCS